MSKNKIIYLLILLTFALFYRCSYKKEEHSTTEFQKGSYGYDVQFLKKYYDDIIELSTGNSRIAISPSLQGRIMTSTAKGNDGFSFGWINYDLISSQQLQAHINPFGGEERFWIGPEGGQFSIYFKEGSKFDFENWQVPKEIDTESFDLISNTSAQAVFEKEMQLTNYSGSKFSIKVNRKILLFDSDKISQNLKLSIPDGIEAVGFLSVNTLSNKGENTWDKDSGMLSVWILSMFKPTDQTIIVAPYKPGTVEDLGRIVTQDYFGDIPKDRIIMRDSILFFRADGNFRSKIGISPRRAKRIVGSYDALNNVLTIAKFTLNTQTADYVNSLWVVQDEPFRGDAFNAYNDGPLESGEQIGPFYELESSSPAANLLPGGAIVHEHHTYHFTGNEKGLDIIANKLLGCSLKQIKQALNNEL